MGLYLKKLLPNAALGVWEISEPLEEICSKVELSKQERKIFSCFQSPLRKQQWLSYRLILPYLVKPKEKSSIDYDKFGKPYLNNGVKHISVSHSGKFSALIASNEHSVGIDIEKIQPKIVHLAERFMNSYELDQISGCHEIESLYLVWTSKEAIYKLYGKKDILFKDHINILPFNFEGEGTITGEINTPGIKKKLNIQYQIVENYLLAYTIDNQLQPAVYES